MDWDRWRGVNRFRDGKFSATRMPDGLGDDLSYAILEDDRNQLWISCNRRVFRVSKQELNEFVEGRLPFVHSYLLWYRGWDVERRVQWNPAAFRSSPLPHTR